jgi:hypothetical protein
VERGHHNRILADYDAGMRALAEGRYAEAERHMRAAVEAATRRLQGDDPRLAVYLTGLAVAYVKQAEDADAEPLLRRVLAIREQALGGDDPLVPPTPWSFSMSAVLPLQCTIAE